jgi:adenylylsulfate kinase-like enzyme
MKLIYLHGPPASGKLTIARELSARTNCGVFDNHLAIDLVRPFFEFGSDEFWKLVGDVRLTCVRGAAAATSTVVYTSCYDHPADLARFEEIERIVQQGGGTLSPIYLQCSMAELERRVTAPSRVAIGKVRSVMGLHAQLRRWNCVAVPRNNCITIVTDSREPSECAEQIIDALGLRDFGR